MKDLSAKKKEYPRKVIASAAFVVLIIAVSLFAGSLAVHDPTEIDLLHKLAPSSATYPMGTDDYGRCIFCRCLYAVRNSVALAVSIEFVSVVIGTLVGMFSSYHGGTVDAIISVISDALVSFPSMILVMLIVAFLGPKTRNIIIALLLVDWIWYARVARGITLSLKEQKYIQAATLSGASAFSILTRHIFPGLAPQMVAQFTLCIGGVILSLAGFSFLGIGVQRPTPELGVMISDACGLVRTNFSVLLWPCLLLVLIVLSFNILGDYVCDRLRKEQG